MTETKELEKIKVSREQREQMVFNAKLDILNKQMGLGNVMIFMVAMEVGLVSLYLLDGDFIALSFTVLVITGVLVAIIILTCIDDRKNRIYFYKCTCCGRIFGASTRIEKGERGVKGCALCQCPNTVVRVELEVI